MVKIDYPALKPRSYLNTYLKFPLNNFLLSGADVSFCEDLTFLHTDKEKGAYVEVRINGKRALIDMQDGPKEYFGVIYEPKYKAYEPEKLNMPIFKINVRPDMEYADNIFPYGPYQVWHNKDTKDLEKFLSYGNTYNPFDSNSIINTTSHAYEGTRAKAYAKLDYSKIYPEINFIRERVSQYKHWDRLGNSLGVLNISGSSANVVDKAPIEAMWQGICVIHNDIDILLPYGKALVKNEHYICLKDDYSDINEKINFLFDNREKAKEMGTRARELMLSTSTPESRTNWMIEVVENFNYK